MPVLIIPPANEAGLRAEPFDAASRVPQERPAVGWCKISRGPRARRPATRRRACLLRGDSRAASRVCRGALAAGQAARARGHIDDAGAALPGGARSRRAADPLPGALRAAYVRVAAPGILDSILIDGRRELAAGEPTGLLDDHVIQDTHHPTLTWLRGPGQAVLRELGRKQIFGASICWSSRSTRLRARPHFGMDAERWATMCERTSEHYRRVAGYRYDPAERMEKSRRYAEAARRIRKGVSPDDLEMPGVGVSNRSRPRDSAAARSGPRGRTKIDQTRNGRSVAEGRVPVIPSLARPASPEARRWHPRPRKWTRRRNDRHWRGGSPCRPRR